MHKAKGRQVQTVKGKPGLPAPSPGLFSRGIGDCQFLWVFSELFSVRAEKKDILVPKHAECSMPRPEAASLWPRAWAWNQPELQLCFQLTALLPLSWGQPLPLADSGTDHETGQLNPI